jgi:hypothetical protein
MGNLFYVLSILYSPLIQEDEGERLSGALAVPAMRLTSAVMAGQITFLRAFPSCSEVAALSFLI